MHNHEHQPHGEESSRPVPGDSSTWLGSKFFRLLKRELSMPSSPASVGTSTGLAAERVVSPRLATMRSGDQNENSRRNGVQDRHVPHSSLGPTATRHGSLLFSQRKQRFHRKHSAEDEITLRQLRSEDSTADDPTADDSENGGAAASHPDNSSRQLNMLWEDDPGSKSEMFLSLLNIENEEEKL